MIVTDGPTFPELDALANSVGHLHVIRGRADGSFMLRPTDDDWRLLRPYPASQWHFYVANVKAYAGTVGPGKDPRAITRYTRKVNAVCWHGHYNFMWALFKHFPNATLETHLAQYEGIYEFLARAPEVARVNRGSEHYKLMFAKCCLCEPIEPLWEDTPCAS